jgi:hypothetical protein
LDPILKGVDNLNACSASEEVAILWSFGNYKTTRCDAMRGSSLDSINE